MYAILNCMPLPERNTSPLIQIKSTGLGTALFVHRNGTEHPFPSALLGGLVDYRSGNESLSQVGSLQQFKM